MPRKLALLFLFVASLFFVLLVSSSNQSAQAAEPQWTALFDGSNLDQWRGFKLKEVPKGWKVDDGLLYSGGHGNLVTREQFDNFELKLEWKISKAGNSGVMYRVSEKLQEPYFTGPEFQLLDNPGYQVGPTDDTAAGSLYALYEPAVDASRAAGEWNTARIVLQGNHVEHWLNGKKTVECELDSDDWNKRVAASKFKQWSEFGKPKTGHITLQGHGNPVWFRNIKIRKLEAKPAAPAKFAKGARVLFVSQSAGFKHGSVTRKSNQLSPAEQALTDIALRSGLFRVTCTQDVANDFTKETLQGFDIVVFYTTGDLPIAKDDLDYFLNDWLKQSGHGFIGTHSATDTLMNHKPYTDMIGGIFKGHPWRASERVIVTVHDSSHPVVKSWGEEFEIQDEIYAYKNWQPENVRVLMSLNMEKTKIQKPYHVPICWVKEYGQGKVMHMSLGHRPETWRDARYRETLLNTIKWMLGKEPGDATPNPDVSAAEQKKASRMESVTR